jgi:transposase
VILYELATGVRAFERDSAAQTLAAKHGLRARHILPLLAICRTKHGSGLGRWRWVVERTFAWLNQIPSFARPLRQTGRHPRSLPLAWLCVDLLAVAAQELDDGVRT